MGRLRTTIRPLVWSGILFIILGILIGTGFFTFVYARGTSYLSDDPNTCVNCHVMRPQFEAWGHSSHARVATCNDCHTPHNFPGKWIVKGINGFNHSAAFTLGGFHEPITITDFNAQVLQDSCVYCHQNVVNVINTLHADEPLQCVNCHSDVGHRTRD